MSVIKWLLEDDAPGVAYVARQRLLDEDPASRKMKSLRRRCNEYPPAARMLDRLDEALAARNYKKYQGAHWTLIFLANMQADGRDKRVRKLAEHVLSTQLANGGFSASGQPRVRESRPAPVAVLVRFQVRAALRRKPHRREFPPSAREGRARRLRHVRHDQGWQLFRRIRRWREYGPGKDARGAPR